MGLRRPGATKEYEEMPGVNVPVENGNGIRNGTHRSTLPIQPNGRDRPFEMTTATVSVVPDGMQHF